MPGRLRILLVDGDDTVVDFLEVVFRQEGFKMANARDADSTMALLTEFEPHLVVLDLDCAAACRQIRSISLVPILVLTTRSAVDEIVSALDAGADDYMTKPFRFKELMARVRAMLRRAGLEMGSMLSHKGLVLHRSTRCVSGPDGRIELTSREFALMELLMERPGQVFSREQILQRLWGPTYTGESSNAVEVLVRSLRTKIGDRKRTVICSVRGAGYVLQ